jgi:hypothetical protein
VRVDLQNTGSERLVEVRLGADLLGRHAAAQWDGLEAGQKAGVELSFPFASEWRPGRHVLPLQVDYRSTSGPAAPRQSLLAYLILPLARAAEPALRVSAPVIALDLRALLPVRLESADGQPHRARVRVLTPAGLVAPDPAPEVDVPTSGGVTVDVPLLHGAAPAGSRQGLLVVAEALDGEVARMAVGVSAVDVAPDPSWLVRLRAPLLVLAGVLLLAGGLAERHRKHS